MNYRGFSTEELIQEYAPSSMVGGDITPYLAAYAALSAAARARHETQENLRYGPAADHVLDYFPAGPNAPLHIFIHGGYWQALSHRDGAAQAPGLVRAGHAFATLNYTLAPGARLGQMVAECRDALIWLAGQASTLGFDPQRITLSGHSAGAHLAAMVTAGHGAALAAAGMTITDQILISGVFDLEPIAETPVNDPLQLTGDEIATLSPMRLTPPEDIHTRVTVADRDTPEFIRQSRAYAEMLRKAGRPVSFDLQRGRHHFDIILDDATFLSGR